MRGMDGVLQLEFEYIWSFDRIPLAIDQLFASWFWHDLLWTRFEQKENMEINPQIKGEVVAFDFNGAVDMLQTFLPTRPFFPVWRHAFGLALERRSHITDDRLEFKTHPRLDSVALHARTSWHKLALARTSEKLNAFKWHLLSWRGFCFWKGRHPWSPYIDWSHAPHTII